VAAAVTLRLTPLPSTIVGPPKRVIDRSDGWMPAAGVDHVALEPARRMYLRSPVTVEPISFYDAVFAVPRSLTRHTLGRDADGRLYCERPTRFVVSIPRGRVVGCDGAIVNGDDHLLSFLSTESLAERDIRNLAVCVRLPPVEHVNGTMAVLATFGHSEFFGHWMMDMLPRSHFSAQLDTTWRSLTRSTSDILTPPTKRHRSKPQASRLTGSLTAEHIRTSVPTGSWSPHHSVRFPRRQIARATT
jgi:hypothetical protein